MGIHALGSIAAFLTFDTIGKWPFRILEIRGDRGNEVAYQTDT
jgi:hypothetical protein